MYRGPPVLEKRWTLGKMYVTLVGGGPRLYIIKGVGIVFFLVFIYHCPFSKLPFATLEIPTRDTYAALKAG